MKKEYTAKQLEVIGLNSGYNMVLGGPGCGKTDILAERIVQASKENNVKLSDMLCLTFTNRAARGMFDRIQSVLGEDSVDLFVGNIHRYCSAFLFENQVNGVSEETSIMDENDVSEIVSGLIEDELLILEKKYNFCYLKVKDILDIQHLLYQALKNHPSKDYYKKNVLIRRDSTFGFETESDFVDACREFENGDGEVALEKMNRFEYKVLYLAYKYYQFKNEHNLLDFDDLLLYTYDAYYNDNKGQYKRYKWGQIDEIQDLSQFQLTLIDLLLDLNEKGVVVYFGDEQQAIYSFMGASLNSLKFLKERCGENVYFLDKNFRSPKYLLNVYNEYAINELGVSENLLPVPKDNKESDFYDLCVHLYKSDNEEVDRVVETLLPYLFKDGEVNERTALLVTWNSDANLISDKLKSCGMQHFKISGLDSFQTVHMKTIIDHMKIVINEFNIISWSRMLFRIGAVDRIKDGRKMLEEMQDVGLCATDLFRKSGSYLLDFVQLFDQSEIVLFDTETTGVDVFNDDIVQIAAYKVKFGKLVKESFFRIFLYTKKEIPKKLGREVNPLVEIYEKSDCIYERKEGLTLFMEYVGDCVLMGHNVDFDYNILKNNLNRYCGTLYQDYNAKTIDTLKLARIVCPKQRKYKLGHLCKSLGLVLSNNVSFHLAEEDIMVTYELAKYCRRRANIYLQKQSEYLSKKDVLEVIAIVKEKYRNHYMETKKRMFVLYSNDEEYAIIREMKGISQQLEQVCEFRQIEKFHYILEFFTNEVISKEIPNALYSQMQKYLQEFSTYKESDMCYSSSFKEKLFVSTVHKAKGLEFENVIVMRCVDGRYPHFAHNTIEEIEEDKRLFYVAISRSINRLVISGFCKDSRSQGGNVFSKFVNPILHNFTLRFELTIGVKVEIGTKQMRVWVNNENGNLQVKRYNVSSVFGVGKYENQMSLYAQMISQSIEYSSVFPLIESLIFPLGGYVE